MAHKTRKKGKSGNRRAGNVNRRERRARRATVYFDRVLPERKLRRILKTSGIEAAKAYAQEHGLVLH